LAWKGFEPLRVVAIHDESEDVRSFVLASARNVPLPEFRAGQHVAVRLKVGGFPQTRLFSLSNDPRTARWRISVKREQGGLVSHQLHRHVRVGDEIEVSAPRGTFGLQEGEHTVVLLSAGVGVTPLLSMLHALASARSPREVWWVHGARDGRHHSFNSEAAGLIGALPVGRAHVVYSRPRREDVIGAGYDEAGHVNVEMLSRLGISRDADFYLCGPAGFLATIASQLQQTWGVDPSRVRSEVFGVAKSATTASQPRSPTPPTLAGDGPRVTFARSGVVVRWSGAQPSLLDLAEACGVVTQWSCRSGVCQRCECPLIAGAVSYAPEPIAIPSDGSILLCCARPAEDVELDL
jgi:ferredoxin-NADP reductase